MKQTRLMKMLFVPAALSLFAACSSDNDIVGDKNSTEDKGVTLTINATAGGDAVKHQISRVTYNDDYSVAWNEADKVYAFAGSTANAGVCDITLNPSNVRNATLKVNLNKEPENGSKITAYVANNSITAVNNGATATTEGIGNQILVDYSNQLGTYADATSRCVLFGETTYNSANPGELSMDFKYQTTFFKLSLNFPETVEGTAALYLTGDNIYTISRMNTTGANAGQLGNKNGFTITVPSVKVSVGQAKDIYIAMYPGQVQNVKLQAVMADGKTYEFTLGNANLAAGKVYKIAKKGTVVKTEAATGFAGGDGSEAAPYEISNLAELKYLQKEIDKTDNYSKGKYFKLTSDITINGSWTAIGGTSSASRWFCGTFDGNGHSINGSFVINQPTNKQTYGLFGTITGNAVIKNLVNKANIIVNEPAVNTIVGSIVGRIREGGKVVNCSNYGIIESKGDVIGGIVGNIFLNTANTTAVVEACINKGDIKSSYSAGNTFLGGIVGTQNYKSNDVTTFSKIVGCYCNDVTISSSQTDLAKLFVGGVITNVSNNTNADQLQMISCWTSNILYPSAGKLGGIIGTWSNAKYTIDHCWTNASKLNTTQKTPNYVVTKSNTSKEVSNLSNMIEEMNTAWQTAISGTTFKFDATGAIVTNE